MKKLFLILAAAVVLSSCAKRQISFNSQQWKSGKNRYYMTESLIKKLDSEKPDRTEILNLLGTPELEGATQGNELSYFLKSDGLFFGLAMSELCVCFNADGTFLSAQVVHTD